MKEYTIRGRLISILGPNQIIIRNQHGNQQIELENSFSGSLGDWVEISQRRCKVLTPQSKKTFSNRWMDRILDPRRHLAIQIRTQVEREIKTFFLSQNFLEVRTPLLAPCPGMETHIRPFQVSGTGDSKSSYFLPTSPEFAMKKLLVGGLEKIFQISPAFRDEPVSVTHRPEFTLLEWYRSFATYEDIMNDTEQLFYHVSQKIFGNGRPTFQGQTIDLTPPWPRLRVRDLFLEHAKIDLTQRTKVSDLQEDCKRLGLQLQNENETWDDLYFKIWLNCIEPLLPKNRPCFVTRYPASQAALSVIDQDPDGSKWSRRFEIYVGQLELGNAFEELTDPIEQRRRFVEDMELREQLYGKNFPKSPLDEEFLDALEEGMPPCAGIAVGVDRMVMLFANETHLDFTFWI